MKFIRISFICCSIWVCAALINGSLAATWLWFHNTRFNNWFEVFLPSGFISLPLSVPGMFLFWIVFLVNEGKDKLFLLLLKTALLVASSASLIFYLIAGSKFSGDNPVLILLAFIAAISSLMLHRSVIILFQPRPLLFTKKVNQPASADLNI